MNKLEIELIPRTTFFTNVRSLVTPGEWDIIRKKCYSLAGYRCEICNGKGTKWPVECHEIWDYNYDTEVQKLIGLIALCPSCHEVKHIGLAKVKGRYNIALKHLMSINNISKSEAEKQVTKAFSIWESRNQVQWKLDTSFLKQYKKLEN